MSNAQEIQPHLECDACGQTGAYVWGERTLCVECYAEVGSSCAGTGKSELDSSNVPPA